MGTMAAEETSVRVEAFDIFTMRDITHAAIDAFDLLESGHDFRLRYTPSAFAPPGTFAAKISILRLLHK